MLLRSESPSPVDEDDPDTDSRVKRQRLPTFSLEHRRPEKRKLPSCLQTPTEEEEGNLTGARPLTTKRQRCTVLEHGFEHLSLTPPSYPATQAAAIPVVPFPATAVPPEFGFSPSAPQQWWVDVPAASAPPIFQQISSPTAVPVLPAASAPALSADVLDDVRMRSSSWYEPEKDRIVVTDLDASSDDEREEEDDGDGTEGAPKLPRAVLRALLRGDPAARDDDVPRMLLAGLLASPFAPLRPPSSLPPSSLPPLELASFLPGPGSSDEAMDVEQ